jgi:3'-phosphoadenosine 5'-phosphosulfate sulfotransferase (PAPS reductase)/FAD synthetase
MIDPFKITGPTCLSFSGGSTSGYMLWRTQQSNTPDDLAKYLRVVFANTGCEHEKTLEFVRDCERHWGIPIEWVEYRDTEAGYAVVNFETASRNGEPFEAIVRKRNYLPNPVTRFCTSELKIRAMHKRLKSLGWHESHDGWDQFIGIRADEPRRVSKIRARGTSTETVKETMCLPLADAGVGYREVDEFWERQPFKLQLPRRNGRTTSGNCVFCFLKPAAQIQSLMRDEPAYAKPFIRIEALALALASKPSGAVFRSDRPTYAQMAAYATNQDDMFDDNEEAIACFCGD